VDRWGAEIVGVDLSQELDDPTFQAIEAAYDDHTVLVFRHQRLTPAQHLRFARRFGELESSPRTQFALPGYTEILRLTNILDEAGRTWHTDLSYTATPPRGSLLYAVEVPTDARGEALRRHPLPQQRRRLRGAAPRQATILYRHRWRVGDLLMWDNGCAQHLAVNDYDLPQRRLMHRVTVNGSVPV
jgi:alpha-ketoglutarate-dependent taurine dioxygenase